MGKIIKYSEEFKEKALKMLEETGTKNTIRELGVSNQTLYRWRMNKRKMEPLADQIEEQTGQQTQPLEEEAPPVRVEEEKTSENKKQKGVSTAQEISLLEKVERLSAENQRLQGTLNYLIQENKVLLERQQRYLEAISLLAQ